MAGRAKSTAARVPVGDPGGREPRGASGATARGGPITASTKSRAHARDLDRLVHDRTRLAIVSALAASDSLTFTELRAITETTDGNLSVHTRKLEDAGYLSCTKGFEGRTPRTEFALTAAGRKALQKYLDHMEAIISHARRSNR
jgi:DNA-binding transcriptional ArsR family regulator